MADLIDKTIKDLKWYLDTNEEKGVVYFPKFCIENMIKNLKQADTERHAHWIEDKEITELTLTCNCCGYSYIEADPDCEERYDFCPHCGCKMDEVNR